MSNTNTTTAGARTQEQAGSIQEEMLSDGSKVYNVAFDEVIYCKNQIAAINLLNDVREAIERAC